MKIIFAGFIALVITGCVKIPEGIKPVNEFELERYLGKWYEIARLNNSFEDGLENVTAEYSLRSDGVLRVVNKGFLEEKNKWKTAEAKAYFVNEKDSGFLKVSFFGPFHGSYIIFELDKENYQYAFVTSSSKSYLWLLARTQTVNQAVIDRFIKISKEKGFDTDSILFVKHG